MRQILEEAKAQFPQGMSYQITYDTTQFVSESIHEVVKTLLEAFALVVIVVFLFLGSIRATIIPLIAVPVSLIGTFAVMMALGFSANTVSTARAGAGHRHRGGRCHRGGRGRRGQDGGGPQPDAR